jgi:predicted lipoprotein with Yx(FWY)xxD motif
MKRKTIVLALVGLACVAGAAVAVAPGDAATKKAKLHLRSGKLGHFIVDANGMTLYLFEKDTNGKSHCTGACAKVWSPYRTSGKPSVGSGLSAAKAGTTKRSDGTIQATYGGHPLYHYDDDHKAGQTEGQGSKEFGAEWYVVGANGKKIDES